MNMEMGIRHNGGLPTSFQYAQTETSWKSRPLSPRQTPMIFVNSFVRKGSFLYPIFVAPLTHSIENRN